MLRCQYNWTQVKQLQQRVEAADHIALKLNWDTLLKRKENEDQLEFAIWDNKNMIAFLALYPFGDKMEVSGMVDPDYRRLGHATTLLKEALTTIHNKGFSEILLITPSKSSSGKAFVEASGGSFSFSEHQMKFLDKDAIKDALPNQSCQIREGKLEDREAVISMNVLNFDCTREEAENWYDEQQQEEGSVLYVMETKQEIAGSLRVSTSQNESLIYGFSIFPHLQGQGLGRRFLRYIVAQEAMQGREVLLEVAVTNDKAQHLYQACGFQSVHVQDYYRLDHHLL
ncbi:hypothetical protein DCC85_12315 [Paenibacillus sp. CAA11]|uniref:GNAT family N-acetyltransferase n=1 Tax=Paenibacillus sp. CAA11 TaxID=1532905 RepID=UPI000D36E1C8|nr:GNAT family N-acetyltransferase [Paenibacillus sp. CAA11]AWB44926.1 hypothetical protein DCC85_12315 [Paenibacillus sp. CAA11]